MHVGPVEILLIVSSILEFNPLLQALKSVKSKSTKDISVYTFMAISVLGFLWLYYGVTIRSLPLIVGNSIKLVTSFAVIIIYFLYRPNAKVPVGNTLA